MTVSPLAWAGLIGAILALLLLDLHRGAEELSMRDALWATSAFAATAFALVGLRSMFFLLSELVEIGPAVSLGRDQRCRVTDGSSPN